MDNRYYKYGCPALMQDQRFLTNYTRGRVFDQMIRKINSINSSQDYKLFLQQNSETILNKEYNALIKYNTCCVNGKCVKLSNINKFHNIQHSCGCDKQYDFLNDNITIENSCGCKSCKS
jgi:hypothetical protein